MAIVQELLNDVSDDPDLLKKIITGDDSWLLHRNQSPIVPMEEPKRTKTEKSTETWND
jgi:hypothetical protein